MFLGTNFWKYINMIKQWLNKDLLGKESFFAFFLLLVIFMYPLINNNLPFRDDYVRLLKGNAWETLGRGSANTLMHILSFNIGGLTNIAPLTFLLSILILSSGLYLFTKHLIKEKNIFNHIALSFLILFPLFLQNLSYQYDSLTMSSAVALVLMAYIIKYNSWKNYLAIILILTIAIAFFQPAIQLFIALVFMNILMKWKNEDAKFKETMKGILLYLASLIIYFTLFRLTNASTNRTKLIEIKDLFSNFKTAISYISEFLYGIWFTPFLIFFGIICFIFIYNFLINLIKEDKIKNKLIYILAIPLIFVSIWGPFILLDEVFARPRVFIVVNMIVAFIYLYALKNKNVIRVSGALTCLTYLFFVSVSYQYGNLNKYEYEYNSMLSGWISKDINSNKILYEKDLVYLNSHPDFAPNSVKILENLPFLKYIQLPYYNWFSRYDLESHGVKNIYKDLNNVDDLYDWESICESKTAKLIIENQYYNIYIINNPKLRKEQQEHVSVWFKRSDDLCNDIPNTIFKRNLFFHEK